MPDKLAGFKQQIEEEHPANLYRRLSLDESQYNQLNTDNLFSRLDEIKYVGETRREWLEDIGIMYVGQLAITYAQWLYDTFVQKPDANIDSTGVEQMILHARKHIGLHENVSGVVFNQGGTVYDTSAKNKTGMKTDVPSPSDWSEQDGWDTLDTTDNEDDTGDSADSETTATSEPQEPALDAPVITVEEAAE